MSDEIPSSNPKRKLKIGSQRPGHEPEPVKKQAPTPTIPQPVHRQVQAPAPETPSTSATVEAPKPEETTPAPQVNPTPAPDATPVPAGDLGGAEEMSLSAQAIVDQVTAPDVDLEMSDADLEREIALAMGEGVEDLMDSQVQTKSDTPELETESRHLATVVQIYRETALFELPGQRNGAVPLRQFDDMPEVGSQLEVMVVGFSPEEQMYELAVPGASVHVEDWSDLQENAVVEAMVTGHNKGGLETEVNHIRGFIPAREISLFRVEDFSTFVGQKLSCVVKEVNEERRNLVLSHRAILEREREAAREQLMEALAVGQTREGTVARLEKFGAFVDLGGVDGLIHISQLSWDNIRHPDEVLSVGQQVKVRIDKIDTSNGRIGLSYRDLIHQPWEGIEARYPVGAVVTGTVSKIMDFGAFVKLEPGVEGLVHISELSHKRVNRVSHVVEEGQDVEVKVLSVDPDSQKISLSMKAAAGVPTADAAAEDDDPIVKHTPKVPLKSLKGGVERPSGGDQFGLKW